MEAPVQVAQSGWQERQEPEAEKVFAGQVATHSPAEASWLEEQVKQNVVEPAQVLQEESQAGKETVRNGSSQGRRAHRCRLSYPGSRLMYPRDNWKRRFHLP